MKAVDYIRVSTAEQAELSLTYSYFLVDGVTIKSTFFINEMACPWKVTQIIVI